MADIPLQKGTETNRGQALLPATVLLATAHKQPPSHKPLCCCFSRERHKADCSLLFSRGIGIPVFLVSVKSFLPSAEGDAFC